MKKLNITLFVLMVLLPTLVHGQEFTEGYLKYTPIDETTAKVSGCNKSITPEAITIPATVTNDGETYAVVEIEEEVFYNSNISSVTLSEGLIKIGVSAFAYNNKIASMAFPKSLTTIENKALYGCGSIKTLTLPENITTIGNQAFFGCDLTAFMCLPTTPPAVGTNLFSKSTFSIYVPEGCVDAYKAAWPAYGNQIKVDPTDIVTVDAGNDAKVWGESSAILIRTDRATRVGIAGIGGATEVLREIPAGESRCVVAPGLYVVTIGGKTVKVLVEK